MEGRTEQTQEILFRIGDWETGEKGITENLEGTGTTSKELCWGGMKMVRLKKYLDDVRTFLPGTDPDKVDEILREIESHLLERAGENTAKSTTPRSLYP